MIERHFAVVNLNEIIEGGHVVRAGIVLTDEECRDAEGDFSEAVGQAILESDHGTDYAYIYTEPDVQEGRRIIGGADLDDLDELGTGFRKNTGRIGTIWRPDLDAFVEFQPAEFPSWTLDPDRGVWVAPVPFTENLGMDHWDEEQQTWGKPPDVYESWVWDTEEHRWAPPEPYPYDLSRDTTTNYVWNEETVSWEADTETTIILKDVQE